MNMKKNQKVLLLLIVLLLLTLLCRSILTFKSITYKLDVNGKKITIKEVLDDSYYIEIKTAKKTYPFRIYQNLNKKRKIVKKVYLYKDKNIECILPIIDDRVYLDMMCYKDDILYDYHQIIEESKKIDKYANRIKLYNKQNFIDKFTDITQIGTVKFNNIDYLNHIIAITTYKGLIINNSEINLFKKDIYNNKLSLFTKGYYLVADYENDYSYGYIQFE